LNGRKNNRADLHAYRLNNEAVNCLTDYAGGVTCKKGSSGGGFWVEFSESLLKGSAVSRAEKSTLQRCMVTYSYIAK
jgi:hypothetical protein